MFAGNRERSTFMRVELRTASGASATSCDLHLSRRRRAVSFLYPATACVRGTYRSGSTVHGVSRYGVG
jgi:hypothetical protein